MAIARISRHQTSGKIRRHIFENAPKPCLAASKQQAASKQANPDFSPFRIRIFSEISVVIARISPHLTSGFFDKSAQSHPFHHPDKFQIRIRINFDITVTIARISRHQTSAKIRRHIFENAPKPYLATTSSSSKQANPDFSPFRIRIFSEILVVIA